MKRTVLLALMLILPVVVSAQSASKSESKSPCVILSSTAPAKGIASWSREGQAQKHMLTYLAGDYPSGMPFRSSMKDKEVDKIKSKGGRVIILDPNYTR